MLFRVFAVGSLLLGGCLSSWAGQISFDFTGNFTFDNDVQLFTVTLETPALLTAWTTSGATGGFPTYLALYDGTGAGITQQAGDPTCLNGFSSYINGECNDAAIQVGTPSPLAAGTYYLALTQWNNQAVGNLSDGFYWVDLINNPNFTAVNLCADSGYFCDAGTQMHDNSNWALTIQLSDPDTNPQGWAVEGEAPEPSSGLLVLAGLSGAWSIRARKRRGRHRTAQTAAPAITEKDTRLTVAGAVSFRAPERSRS